jgi:hypothetical protein
VQGNATTAGSGQKIRVISMLLRLCVTGQTIVMAQSSGTFAATGAMSTARVGHTATLLPNGKVLIAGGVVACLAPPSCVVADSAELYDPVTGAFVATGAMNTVRASGGVLLPDGRVLFAGSDLSGTLFSIEIYDPSTERFTVVGKQASLTAFAPATLLNDGRVLLIGRVGTSVPAVSGAELYDPAAGTFRPVANWPAQLGSFLAVLADGRVLFESDDTGPCLYDPASGTFSPFMGPINTPLSPPPGSYGASLLANGQVLFAGGNSDSGNLRSAELYDPAAGTFAATRSMFTARAIPAATLLSDGTVLVAGGLAHGKATNAGSGPVDYVTASAEIYDPATATFSATASLTTPRYNHRQVLLNNGQVLIAGGVGAYTPGSIAAVSSAEIYTPAVLIPAPALFSLSGDGQGQGAIWHAATGQVASASNPAIAGGALSMYTTGLADGGVIPPQVVIGGRLAEILFFGKAPGYPAFNQVNFRVPSGVVLGPAVPVRLTYVSRPSNSVTIGVQ